MTVGVCVVELYIPGKDSLKGKRQIIKSIKDRIRNRFNVSIAEIGEYDLWQKSVLGIACIGNEKRYVHIIIQKVVNLIRQTPSIEIINFSVEMI